MPMTLGEAVFGSRYNQVKQQFSSAKQQPSISSAAGQFGSIAGVLQGIAGQNTSSSAKQAEELRKWQEEQYRIMREYNSAEAQKNRDWQERMSSSAHQREVRDLIAAGLNPVLSVTGGSGAAVTSGATASSSAPSGAMGSVDNSATGAVAGLFGSLLNSLLSLEGARVSAQSNQAIADKYTAMSKYTSELQSQTQLTTANIQAMAQKYTADAHLAGTKYAADSSAAASKVSASIHAAAQKYGYDVQSMTQKDIAAFNASVNKDLQEAGFKHDFDIRESFPSNAWQAFGPELASGREALDQLGLPWGDNIFDYAKMIGGAVGDTWSGKAASKKR